MKRTITIFASILFVLTSCSQKPERMEETLTNWRISPSSEITDNGNIISSAAYNDSDWIGAEVPSTVMGIISEHPEYENILTPEAYYEANKAKFNNSWWYRTQFEANEMQQHNTTLLHFDGISYSANIWLNGKLIAASDSISGSFRRFEFNISNWVTSGTNTLAVEVFRQRDGDFGLGFVDWNPRPLDENMGIWRPVTVETVEKIQIKNSYVRSEVNTQTLDEAWLTTGATLKNFTNKQVDGALKITFNGKQYEYPVSLPAAAEREITLTHNDIPGFYVENPDLWWSNGLGEPHLHQMDIEFTAGNKMLDSENIEFGIREIESYFNETGKRGFKLNGKEILIKGAGWTDDIFLRDTPESNELQVQYVKNMGLNTIRFETVWGTTSDIYSQCDRNGILAMVGWSCQWEWENYLGKTCDDFGGASTEEDFDLLTDYLRDQILWLRNHPSIFVWLVGSDMLPRPELEKRYIEIFEKYDDRPWLGAAADRTSELSGPTGVKMHGPYEYVGPSYWYIDKKFGGAYGFNTETGPGTQLPVKKSIERMLPEDKRWPLNEYWNKYCTTSATALNSMDVLTNAINQQWGKAESFDEYVMKGHLVNYEAIRAMFEAFRANRPQATGVIQWMLNSAWPSFYWQLYDYYMVPTPAYYGTKKALEPVQLVYNYRNHTIAAVNEQMQAHENARATITLYDASSNKIKEYQKVVTIPANGNIEFAEIGKPDETTLLFLELEDKNGNKISDNFYWISEREEKYKWEETNWVYTPMEQHADYKALNNMKTASVTINAQMISETRIEVELNNSSDVVSMFNQLKLHDSEGEWIIPAFYSDNYFSMAPGGRKTIDIELPKNSKGDLWLEISGFNTTTKSIKL
ncbi:MAG: beta galactosidase jelly roll domain-containing protein [Prolixibacteraceae bacterium]|jgi:exo-1,4-beta-D-glucosaminidase|nr:beta galactosidase jelly roll domain-containing protein [Prolixibacteraceae bacterium]